MREQTLFPVTVFALIVAFMVIASAGMIMAAGAPVIKNVNITYKNISGEAMHGQVYEVMIIDDTINPAVIEHALMMVPNQYAFVMVDHDPSRYGPIVWEDWPVTPWPNEDYLILVTEREQYPGLPAAGWTVRPTGRIVIAPTPYWHPVFLAEVIEHECGHNVEIGDKLDFMALHTDEFTDWTWRMGYGIYPDQFTGWNLIYQRFVLDEYLTSIYEGVPE